MLFLGILLLEATTRKLISYVTVALLSSVKFTVGVGVALAKNYGFWEIIIFAGGGAWLGSVIITYFGNQIRKWLERQFNSKPKSFAYRRRIYKLWKRYGLTGVAFLAPILSPPVSIGIAVSFHEKPTKIILYMTISLLFWVLLFASMKETAAEILVRE